MEVEKILGVLKMLTKDDFNNINSNAADGIKRLMDQMEEEIRKNNNKKSGKANVSKAAMAIIKNIKNANVSENIKEQLGAYIDDGKQYVCDGYRVLVINKPADIPENKKHLDVKNILKAYDLKNINKNIDIPSLSELKSEMKLLKAENRASRTDIYNVRLDNGQVINLQYLIEGLEAFGSNYKCYVGTQKVSPIIIKNDEVFYMLLPVRCKEEHKEKYFITDRYGK